MSDAVAATNPLPRVEKANRYCPVLDGVRGLAILMVLMVHLEFLHAVPGGSWLARQIREVMAAGWSGVDLFFVLSGFLITGILLDSKESRNYFSSFYARRTLRIFPLYYLTIFIGILTIPFVVRHSWVHSMYPSTAGWASYIFYVQNWWIPWKEPTHSILGHFWSLGVEEQFYLLWPACVLLVPRRHLLKLCGAGCVAALLLRCYLVQSIPSSDVIYMNTFTRMDSLLCGAACALIVRSADLLGKVRRILPILAGSALLGMFFIDFVANEMDQRGVYTQSVGYSLLAMGYGAFLLAAYLHNETKSILDRFLRTPLLTKFGKYSYGIYVYHGPVFFLGTVVFSRMSWFGRSTFLSWLYCAGIVLLTFEVAKLSYNFYEKRFLLLKRYFEPQLHGLTGLETQGHSAASA